MARILCVWEMGGGLGHLSNLKSFVDVALKQGHQVSLAAKELQNLTTLFSDYSLTVYQSPYLHRSPTRSTGKTISYPQLVLQRFETADELAILCRAWESIFDAVKPDLVVYDFAPSALVASLHRPWKKWVIGSGFLVPRTDAPYFGVFPYVSNTPEYVQLIKDAERLFLQLVNTRMAEKSLGLLTDLRQIILQADQQLLLTIPELDHFGVRPDGQYLGVPANMKGAMPSWPTSGRCKVFGYLSGFSSVEKFFTELTRHDVSVLVYSREIRPAVKAKFPQIAFVDTPVDMDQIYRQADLVVNMASHTTCAQSLMFSVPQLMIPLRQEQFYLAQRIVGQKGGVIMLNDDAAMAEKIAQALEMVGAGKLPFDSRRRQLMSGELLEQRIEQLYAELPV